MSTTVWVLVILAAVVAAAIWLFNGLVALRNQVKNAWSQIDVQLERRHDLIPNLVASVQGYLQHEREVLTQVTEARGQAMRAKGPAEAGVAETVLSRAVTGLFAVMENYPDLKANQNVLGLQEELTSTENRIGFARQFYNDTVTRYNTRQEIFPVNLFAAGFGFRPAEFFQIDNAADREVPRVDLTRRG